MRSASNCLIKIKIIGVITIIIIIEGIDLNVGVGPLSHRKIHKIISILKPMPIIIPSYPKTLIKIKNKDKVMGHH